MLRYAAVCCSCNVLQCVAVCCSVLRCVAVCLYSYIVHGHLVTRPWHNHWEGRLQHCVAVCCCVFMSQYCSVSLFTVHTDFETQHNRNTPCLFEMSFAKGRMVLSSCGPTYCIGCHGRAHCIWRHGLVVNVSRLCTNRALLWEEHFTLRVGGKRQPVWRHTNYWRGSCTADTRWRRRIW